jgi:hypothetical protein
MAAPIPESAALRATATSDSSKIVATADFESRKLPLKGG